MRPVIQNCSLGAVWTDYLKKPTKYLNYIPAKKRLHTTLIIIIIIMLTITINGISYEKKIQTLN